MTKEFTLEKFHPNAIKMFNKKRRIFGSESSEKNTKSLPLKTLNI